MLYWDNSRAAAGPVCAGWVKWNSCTAAVRGWPEVAGIGAEASGAGVAAGGGGADPGIATSFQSSPSPTNKAIRVPTLAPEPSSMIIFATIPSSSASIDTTALSVWMSQRTSPAAMASPSALCHLTMVPSSMVGLRLGMLTLVPGVLPPQAATAAGSDAGGTAEDSAETPLAATCFQSSPSSASNAINVFTFTVVFSSIRCLARTPSSEASMAMTALSV